MIGVFRQRFLIILHLFLVPLLWTGLLPIIQLSVPGFILSFGARHLKVLMLSASIGRARIIGWCLLFILQVVLFFIWKHAGLVACLLSLIGLQQFFGPLFFRLVVTGHLLFSALSFLTLILFSHPLVRDTRLFSVHLDSGRQFWLSASMVPLVFPDKLVSSHPVGDIFFLSCLAVCVFSTL